jgi:hypothetical protein
MEEKTKKQIFELLDLCEIIFTKAKEDKGSGFKEKFLANQQLSKIKNIRESLKNENK